MAASVQPSKLTCGSVASSRRSRSRSRRGVLDGCCHDEVSWPSSGLFGTKPARFTLEDQLVQIGHALGIENAVQVIKLVLHHDGVEPLDRAVDRARLRGVTPV